MASNRAVDLNGGDDEDEALRIAIALSMGQNPSKPSSNGNKSKAAANQGNAIDLTQDDDDDYSGGIDLTKDDHHQQGAEDGGDDSSTASEAESTTASPPKAVLVGARENTIQSKFSKTNAAVLPAVAAVKQQQEPQQQQPVAASSTPAPTPSSLSALLGLDRKKMEEERLSRLKNKRKASSDLGTVSGGNQAESGLAVRPSQRQRTTNVSSSSSSSSDVSNLIKEAEKRNKKKAMTIGDLLASDSASSSPSSSPQRPHAPIPAPGSTQGTSPGSVGKNNNAGSSKLPFPHGVVKKTWVLGQPRRGDDIKIEEVLQRRELELAVLSSYQWDEKWLLTKVDISRTKLVLVAFGTDEKQKEEMRSAVPSNRIRFCFPPMNGPGSMHSKLQLLKYANYLRIVVPSANLVPYDWGESGHMENMVFIIDLPRLSEGENDNREELTPFAEDLLYFLTAQGLDHKLVSGLRKYDFSETSRYAFVHTIAGSHTSEDAWKRTGYCGLGRAVKALGLDSSGKVLVDYVCASIGSVKKELVMALYYACQGDSGLKEYGIRLAAAKAKSKSKRKGDTKSTDDTQDDAVAMVLDNMRVYFPSLETVIRSRGGKSGAGTVCCQKKWFEAETFPRGIMRDCVNVRKGVLMHSKVIYVRSNDRDHGQTRKAGGSGDEDEAKSGSTPLNCHDAFAYVGSANLSESAWGHLSTDKTTKKPKLTCRNWECGVILPVVNDPSPQTKTLGGQRLDGKIVEGNAQGSKSGGAGFGSGTSSSTAASRDNLGGNWSPAFEGRVPVPMELPAERLESAVDGSTNPMRQPWYYQGG